MAKIKDFGLYQSQFEHDACGIGAVCNINGEKSHKIIDYSKQILLNLHHRGAAGADEITGDGAGILMQMPDDFLHAVADEAGICLPGANCYGCGNVFGPKDDKIRNSCDEIFADAISYYGLTMLGWRKVAVNRDCLGRLALAAEPDIRQVFIDGAGLKGNDLERKLYLIRKRAEKKIREKFSEKADDYYIVSLSGATLNYKGMFMAHQLFEYYQDLADERMKSAIAIVHQRYSTNTFPSWRLAQPFRCIAHNGEINTLSGNCNRMRAREQKIQSPVFGEHIKDLVPVIAPGSSDSASFDNVLELLSLSGRTMPHSMMMMIPEAFGDKYHISTDKRSFYEYHASIMEPWDGPAAMVFTDGEILGGTLDRNGLRPCRYVVTKDGFVVMASEAGVIEFQPEQIKRSGRLQPGKMFLVDTSCGRIITDNEIKSRISRQKPYRRWLVENREKLPTSMYLEKTALPDEGVMYEKMRMFGYNREELKVLLEPMAQNGQEPIGSMGNDTPLAVLSDRPRLLYDYFKQMFAQVTNPPIDPLREGLVMSLMLFVGQRSNILDESPKHCRQLKLPHPILSNGDIECLRNLKNPHLKSATVYAVFDAASDNPNRALKQGLDKLIDSVSAAVADGASLIIISDKSADKNTAAIPSLLAVSAVHHGMLERNIRADAGIIVETGDAREVMHFCLLCGYGANAVNPYMAFDVLEYMRQNSHLKDKFSAIDIQNNFIASVKKGILKTMSKMGISTLRSYRAGQLFEAVGLDKGFVEKYFTGTVSRIGGVGIEQIAEEALIRHNKAFEKTAPGQLPLDYDGQYSYRTDGETHRWNPTTIAKMQQAVMFNDKKAYEEFAESANDQSKKLCTLRGLFKFKDTGKSIAIEDVESAGEIVKHFCTGAMSHGALSKEAHECIAIAMNRLGAMSNTGEGGENPNRYTVEPNGDSKNCAIKQVASGRFGVTINYLAHAKEIQIKMAQGAKPGEGGQLPGYKVSKEIAEMRFSTPGVTLISPPPHHDIYSIEDLAQLIYDLKCANPDCKVSVKLVSEVGVGTIAAGVAKGNADEVLISGSDGGTGASPLSSTKHAGCPWELGLAETQQTLVLNNLRDRIRIQTDGMLFTGRDVAVAALLGAERFGFGTSALVAIGCVMMRKCHKGTCPVGVCTQMPELRKKFRGKPEYLQRYMLFVAEELRGIMAELGFKKLQDMTGRVDLLEMTSAIEHYKAKGLDLTAILTVPGNAAGSTAVRQTRNQIDKLKDHCDWKLIEKIKDAIDNNKPVIITDTIKNTDRTVGTILSNHIVRKYGPDGLDEGQIKLELTGYAGQSLGAFLIKGVEIHLTGQANDYVGKGLSGGRIIVKMPAGAELMAHENIIVGNTVLYGATSGQAYINGMAGERFAVRNSGAVAVVEGLGDHGCEYMTGGTVVVIGSTGRNFAAGMSGGVAYVLDDMQLFDTLCNLDMVELESVYLKEDTDKLHYLITQHCEFTGSSLARRILERWDDMVGRFVKVMPIDYRKVLERIQQQEQRATETTPATEEVFYG